MMDADMRKALAAGLADVGEDSEEDADFLLDDDFVMQAAGAADVRHAALRGVGNE